jgi:putative ABC transport system permease protein
MTFLIAIRNLIQHRKRTLILGGVLGGVTMLLVILLALGTGVRASLIESATTLSTGHLNVAGFYKVTAGQSAPIVTDYEKILEVVNKSVPDLDFTTTRMRGWARVVSESGSAQWGIAGIDIDKEPRLKGILHLQQGKLEDLNQPNTALLFESQNEKLKVKVGDTVTISAPTPKGVNNTVDVRVVAIADDVGLLSKFNFFVPSQTLRNLYQIKPNTTGAVHVYLKHMSSIPQAQAALRKALEQAGYTLMDPDSKAFWQKFDQVNREDWTGQKLDVTTWEDEVSFLTWILTAINGIVGVLGFVLLIVISIGVMNAMWIAIRERTREIGTLRAIGMQRTRVLTMFLTEGFMLAIVATTAGTALGVLFSALINVIKVPLPGLLSTFLMSPTLKMAFDPAKIIGALVIITAATTLISLIPSFLAARLRPITAMHHIG